MITKKIALSTWKINHEIIYANEGEVNCRYIEVSFLDESENSISLSDRNVTFYAKKPDGTNVFNYCTINTTNNTATVELTSQTLSSPGIVDCEFQIFDGNNVLLKVSGVKIVVSFEKGFSDAVESTSEFNVLTSAINEMEGLISSTGDLSNLNTTEKGTVVGAINEVNSKIIPISNGGTGATTKSAARTNLEVMKVTTLYQNDSGTSGTITLSEDSGSFEYLEVFFRADGGSFASVKIYSPNGKRVHLYINGAYSPTESFMAFAGVITFSDNLVTWDTDNDVFFAVNTSNVHTLNFGRVLYIHKIVGFSY